MLRYIPLWSSPQGTYTNLRAEHLRHALRQGKDGQRAHRPDVMYTARTSPQ